MLIIFLNKITRKLLSKNATLRREGMCNLAQQRIV